MVRCALRQLLEEHLGLLRQGTNLLWRGVPVRRAVGADLLPVRVQRRLGTRRALGHRGGPLFCTLAGGRLSDRYVRDILKRQARKAGLEKRGPPHGLRHAHATGLAAEGVLSRST